MSEWTPRTTEHAVLVRAGGITLKGLLGVPAEARGVILFAMEAEVVDSALVTTSWLAGCRQTDLSR